jgi:hypothetical protein
MIMKAAIGGVPLNSRITGRLKNSTKVMEKHYAGDHCAQLGLVSLPAIGPGLVTWNSFVDIDEAREVKREPESLPLHPTWQP